MTHASALRQVGLTVLDSRGRHQLGRSMVSRGFLQGRKAAATSDGRPCKFTVAQPWRAKSTRYFRPMKLLQIKRIKSLSPAAT